MTQMLLMNHDDVSFDKSDNLSTQLSATLIVGPELFLSCVRKASSLRKMKLPHHSKSKRRIWTLRQIWEDYAAAVMKSHTANTRFVQQIVLSCSLCMNAELGNCIHL